VNTEKNENGWKCKMYPKGATNTWCKKKQVEDGWKHEWFPQQSSPCKSARGIRCTCCQKKVKGWKRLTSAPTRGLMSQVQPTCVAGTTTLVGGLGGKKIPNEKITASSAAEGRRTSVWRSRADVRRMAPWCAKRSDKTPWINWHFNKSMIVTHVKTAGRFDCCDEFVRTYELQYRTAHGWQRYGKSISANSEGRGFNITSFIPPLVGSEFRILPTNWSSRACMRVELQGCVFIDVGAVFGEQGAPGRSGGRGPPGQVGFNGKRGVPGNRGIAGEMGTPGKRGPPGAPGSQGKDVDCAWADWVDWTPCSALCGGGVRQRERGYKVYPQGWGKECLGSVMESDQCAKDPCGKHRRRRGTKEVTVKKDEKTKKASLLESWRNDSGSNGSSPGLEKSAATGLLLLGCRGLSRGAAVAALLGVAWGAVPAT